MTKQFVKICAQSQNCQVQKFGKYFEENYAGKPEEWAIGLRDIFVDTNNMALESFHKILKHNGKFMDGRENRRVDKLLHHLFGYMATMMRMDLINSSCNNVTDKNTAADFKNHMAALKVDVPNVSLIGNGWRVASFTTSGVSYDVTRIATQCPDGCRRTCKQCNVCYHMYSCTCPTAEDAHNRYVSCKHAHLAIM